jgi:hypothetical protein
MRRPRLRILLWLCGLAGGSCLAAPPVPRPAVLELFTSEGCSSCPPAEALLGELAGQPGVLALAFHVDYWNSLGWTDRFALPEATARQARYVTALGLASAYTPQLVLDGRTDLLGTDRAGVVRELRTTRAGVAILITRQDAQLQITLPAQPDVPDATVSLFAFAAEAVSPVTRGENAGRTLHEFNIVRTSLALGRWHGESRRFSVPERLLSGDATAVAVLVQRAPQGPILAAASYLVR